MPSSQTYLSEKQNIKKKLNMQRGERSTQSGEGRETMSMNLEEWGKERTHGENIPRVLLHKVNRVNMHVFPSIT